MVLHTRLGTQGGLGGDSGLWGQAQVAHDLIWPVDQPCITPLAHRAKTLSIPALKEQRVVFEKHYIGNEWQVS